MTGPIRIVLDTSAIGAYARTSLPVGEIVAEVAEENARIGVPLACLAEVHRRKPPLSDNQLDGVVLLTSHPHVVVADTDPQDWRALAGLVRDLGRVDAAAALLLAVDCGGYVFTAEPDAYGDWKHLPVIPFEEG